MNAAGDGGRPATQRVEGLLRYEGIALANVVTGRLHRRGNLVRYVGSVDAAERPGEPSRDDGVAAVQQAPKQIGGVRELASTTWASIGCR